MFLRIFKPAILDYTNTFLVTSFKQCCCMVIPWLKPRVLPSCDLKPL